MRVLLFSDVHGNLTALENILKSEIVDFYINLGDVVNYGPWSNECVELLNQTDNIIHIKGNHEEYFINDHCDVPNKLVVDFFRQCRIGFKYHDVISNYSSELIFEGFKLKHTLGVKEYIFKDTDISLSENMLIGHSHQQYIRYLNGFLLANPGSVGQNRKFINTAEYIVWNTVSGLLETKRVKFELKYVISEMKKLKYPQQCIDYYKSKPQLI